MRISLSPEPEEWHQGRYRFRDDYDSSSTSSSGEEEFVSISHDDCEYSSDSDDYEDNKDDNGDGDGDYAHPVGFPAKAHSSWGRTRFSLDPTITPESIEEQWERYDAESSTTSSSRALTEIQPFMQSYPPLESYIDPKTAPTVALLQFTAHRDRKIRMQQENDREIDQITQLLQAASMVDTVKALGPPTSRTEHETPLALLAATADDIRHELEKEKRRMEREHLEAAQALKMLLEKNKNAANAIRKEERRIEQEEQMAEDERRKIKQKRELAEKERQRKLQEQKEGEEAQKAAEVEIQRKVTAQQDAEEAAKTEYVTKAKKLVAQLVQLRASIEPFEKSKAVGKRRLGMKKIVRGKVNTLAENAEKIKSVAADVSQAITEARAEDEELKKQQKAGNTQITSEMTRGKRYLVDLLASDMMVRVQAEGFNGLRGDGFPMANMLALVSLDNKELNPILAAHIYTVCPTAIPKLPSPAAESSEDALMRSLGMAKDKKGEYETFDRFLLRTEGIISLVANIMASNPPTHQLMGGNKGAVDWLGRFLGLLPPPPQSPLPLLTAPVLDAFLTGAGHMLANKHPEEFKKHLDVIMNEIIDRLDEGPVGQPSAIRLRKTAKDGFDGFKNTLPHKALPELYYGADGAGAGGGFGGKQQSRNSGNGTGLQTGFPRNPFAPSPGRSASSGAGGNITESTALNPFAGGGASIGTGSNFSSNPFGTSATTSNVPGPAPGAGDAGNSMQDDDVNQPQSTFGVSSTANPSPFGQSNSNATGFGGAFGGGSNPGNTPFGSSSISSGPVNTANPFGPKTGVPGPFGQTGSTPFGQPSNSTSTQPSLFGSSQSTSQTTPFGKQVQSPSPFGAPSLGVFGGTSGLSNPFGRSSTTNTNSATSNPFAAFSSGGASQSPFAGGPQKSTPFGGGLQQQQSPFVGGSFGSGAQQQSPFGGGTQQQTPFGRGSAPFGGAQQQTPFGQTSPFGGNSNQDNRPPCKFFAKGQCKYGNNCRFSHTSGGGGGGFGGPNRY